jgi:hypothetical protein
VVALLWMMLQGHLPPVSNRKGWLPSSSGQALPKQMSARLADRVDSELLGGPEPTVSICGDRVVNLTRCE